MKEIVTVPGCRILNIARVVSKPMKIVQIVNTRGVATGNLFKNLLCRKTNQSAVPSA